MDAGKSIEWAAKHGDAGHLNPRTLLPGLRIQRPATTLRDADGRCASRWSGRVLTRNWPDGGETFGQSTPQDDHEVPMTKLAVMAHPDEGRLVPARVQHAVLDPQENALLARAPPIRRAGT